MGGPGSGKRHGILNDPTDREPLTADPERDEEREDDAIRAQADEIRDMGGGFVRASKLNTLPNGKPLWQRAGTYPVESFDADSIAEKYGPGEYRFKFYNSGNMIVAHRGATWAEPLKPVKPEAAPPPAAAVAESATHMLQMLMAQQAQAIQRSHETTLALISALGGGRAQGNDSAGILEAVKVGREMAAASAPPPIGAQAIELFTTALQLGRSAKEEADAPDPLMALAPKLLDIIAGAVKTVPSSAPRGAAGAPSVLTPKNLSPAAPAVSQPTSKPSGTPAPPADIAAAALKQYAPQMLAEARAGRDGRAWGYYIGERLPAFARNPLMDLALMDDPARDAAVLAAAPELAPALPWLADAFEGMLDVLDPQDEDPDGGENGRLPAEADTDNEDTTEEPERAAGPVHAAADRPR